MIAQIRLKLLQLQFLDLTMVIIFTKKLVTCMVLAFCKEHNTSCSYKLAPSIITFSRVHVVALVHTTDTIHVYPEQRKEF